MTLGELTTAVHKLSAPPAHHNPVLGTTWSSVGAVLIVVGAILVLADSLTGQTWGGDNLLPQLRLFKALAFAGSLLILSGSAVLVAVAGVSVPAVAAVVGFASLLVYGLMAFYLWRAWNGRAKVDVGVEPHRSPLWCLCHPRERVRP
jgi:hypothetical protein